MENLVILKNNEATVSTFVLFKLLGYKEHRALKKVITDDIDEFKKYGSLQLEIKRPDKGSEGGRPEQNYMLNMPQLLLLVALAKNSSDSTLKLKIINSFIKGFFDANLLSITRLIGTMDLSECDHDMYVYIAMMEKSGLYKIGISKNPEQRVKKLNTGNPEKLILIHSYLATNGYEDEAIAHSIYEEHRIRGEWFGNGIDLKELPTTY